MATASPTSCSGCGRQLSAPTAICPFCEKELSSTPVTGRYRCPRCSGSFNAPRQAAWPPNAKWYRPQVLKPQCPHCQSFLLDRKVLPLTWVDSLAAISLVLAVQGFHLKAGVAVTALLVFVAIQLWRSKQLLSSVRNDAERYAIDKNVP